MTIYGRKINDDDMNNIAFYMDDEIRENLHCKLTPCTHEEFINAYLDADPSFLEILENEFDFDTTTWYLVDDCTTSGATMETERLDAMTKEDAVTIARNRFERLSDYDKTAVTLFTSDAPIAQKKMTLTFTTV